MSDIEVRSGDEGDGNPAVAFPLSTAELGLIAELCLHLRSELARLSAYGIRNMATALVALERLPHVTEAVSIVVSRDIRQGSELSYIDVSISEEKLRFSKGGHAYDPDYGGDSFSECLFEVQRTGHRRGGAQDLAQWLEEFREFCGEWAFDNAGDEDVDFHEDLD